MAASSRGFAVPFGLKTRRLDASPLYHGLDFRNKRRRCIDADPDRDRDRDRLGGIYCSSDSATPIRRTSGKNVDKADEWSFELKKSARVVRMHAIPAMPFASSRHHRVSKQEGFYPRCTPRDPAPQSRDTPPKRDTDIENEGINLIAAFDTGIANEKDWGINLLNENINESGINEDGSTWYRESGVDLRENGYRCLWTKMGGQCHDGSSVWEEMWWEKSDWTGYKELEAGFLVVRIKLQSHNVSFYNLARIERSAQKQAKSGTENAGWFENWWEKYDAKGWTEKGAHKYGRLNEQSWWEKWGEHYDGRGSVLKWTDKWAETELGTKWGDKWEEKFFSGIGSRQGETWHVSPGCNRMLVKNMGRGTFRKQLLNLLYAYEIKKVHKFGTSTTGESWDIIVDEETYYEAEPHYGWADVVGDSSQLLSIQPRERPPGIYPDLEFGLSPPSRVDDPPDFRPPSPH
ncbi:hypothetical protein HHK36_008785 [Tetracentron sinense]|uniref:Uncharacterized protein n=1 Tax=Tetracentron sinense TaxID=13715 RepID=A0A834ZG25_TETSI|nr:hypothetical protein HHK36_008785 [Tetracentron sinense]